MSDIAETVKHYFTSTSFKRDQLMDKLSEFMTVERRGIKLYEAALKLVRNRRFSCHRDEGCPLGPTPRHFLCNLICLADADS